MDTGWVGTERSAEQRWKHEGGLPGIDGKMQSGRWEGTENGQGGGRMSRVNSGPQPVWESVWLLRASGDLANVPGPSYCTWELCKCVCACVCINKYTVYVCVCVCIKPVMVLIWQPSHVHGIAAHTHTRAHTRTRRTLAAINIGDTLRNPFITVAIFKTTSFFSDLHLQHLKTSKRNYACLLFPLKVNLCTLRSL